MVVKTKEVGFIFDLDGTILDDIPFILDLHKKIAEDYNFPLTDELDAILRNKVGNLLITSDSDWERFKAMMFLGKKIELPFFSRIKMMFHTKKVIYDFFKNCPLIDGTQETLGFLRKNKVNLGICTNASRSEMNIIFHGREEILDYFDGNIITKDDVKHKKPNPEGIIKLINKWGISPQNIIIFGDYETDIQAGKEAGIRTVGVLSGSGNLDLFKKLKADYVINDISEIPLKFPDLEF